MVRILSSAPWVGGHLWSGTAFSRYAVFRAPLHDHRLVTVVDGLEQAPVLRMEPVERAPIA
jgi:hypothetical protein